ncbi:MAG: hypothetical protein GW778_06100 [Alphaproteobacteria bacterium]|nr:hypothetical protein [Alphaproteobacteria bacterium]
MKKLSIYTIILSLIAPISAHAQTSDWFKSKNVNARLVAGSDNQAALEIDLAAGWHTYWRIPGDSGLPPMLSWADSTNLEAIEIDWPAPKRKKEYEFNTFGYDGNVTFPLTVLPIDPSKDTKLALNAQIMICNDICIPQAFKLTLDTNKDADHTKEDAKIAAAKTKLPSEDPNQDLTIDSIIAAKDALVVAITSKTGFEGIDVFPVIEEDKIALTLPAVIEISEYDPEKAMIRVDNGSDFENIAGALQGKTLTVTLTQGDTTIVKSVQY